MPRRVWATKPFTANSRYIAAGEVVEAAVVYGRNYPKLFSTGYIVEVQQDDRLYEHSPTGFLFITANYRDTFARSWQQAQGGDSTAGIAPQQPAPAPISAAAAAPRPAPAPTGTRKMTRKYSNRDIFVEVLGKVVDTLRLRIGHREPTMEETAHASDTSNGASLWPEGMSLTTLKTRLREHGINFPAFLETRPWPCRRLS
jgi:hypothetical protein